MKYNVIVNCTGAWSFDIEAEDEDCATDIAREKINELSAEEIANGINIADFSVYDYETQDTIYID